MEKVGLKNKQENVSKKMTGTFLTPVKRVGSDNMSVVSRQFSEKPSNIKLAKKNVEMDKCNFYRKVSKYDIDRGQVDFMYLKRERIKEVTENN